MDQRLQYLHSVLKKAALRFCMDVVQPYATTFQQTATMIDREYNSPVRQFLVKDYSKSLRVSQFEEYGTGVSVGLSMVYKMILRLSRQVLPFQRRDAHRVEFLQKAVLLYQ